MAGWLDGLLVVTCTPQAAHSLSMTCPRTSEAEASSVSKSSVGRQTLLPPADGVGVGAGVGALLSQSGPMIVAVADAVPALAKTCTVPVL